MPEPDRASRYILGKEIARGGLGRVLEAFDTELKRPVAVKLILDEMPAEVRERFVREAELTARLEHPNIVPVHGLVGSAAGGDSQLQLAMKRIQGRDLETLVKALAAGDEETAKAWSRPRLLAMFQHICLGVAFAHDRGVIHRDLKPSNVMIGEFGETLIVDWGLAKEKKAAPVAAPPREIQISVEGWATRTLVPARDSSLLSISLTMDGDIVGTPAYMPPEQAEGRVADVDERSDIYALGAILYEILTFRPPVDGASLDELLTRVRSGAILPPSRHSVPDRTAAHIPPELDTIVMKALALRREDRYQDARALHDDIQLFLEGVKELEHRQKAARERVEAGRRWFGVYRELKSEIEAQKNRVKELSEKIRPHQPPAEKRPLWEAEARHRALREERIDAFSRASAEFGQALTVDPANAEALDGKCDLFLDRFLEAERRRDREEMQLNRNTLAQYDGSGKFRAGLEAPGRLTIRASAYGCDCLWPVKVPGWRVEISGTPDIAWRDGGPLPGVPLTPVDRPVPGMRTFPEGATWGHTQSCPRRELADVEVWIAKYDERDKRLVLGPERRLGECPVLSAELEQGSYRCALRPRDPSMAGLFLPVLIERGGHWEQDVTLYRSDEIPAG
ncbi:MAG: serine/threonine protein kinase, partial [Planctomycetes bacterium]|nr:serine/threonine protein kinase [Planctomycetota bacterium]